MYCSWWAIPEAREIINSAREIDFEIPQICLDLGSEDESYRKERSARMYHPELGLTLCVNEPSAGSKRYVLVRCEHGTLGTVEMDDELRELVAFVRDREYSHIFDKVTER